MPFSAEDVTRYDKAEERRKAEAVKRNKTIRQIGIGIIVGGIILSVLVYLSAPPATTIYQDAVPTMGQQGLAILIFFLTFILGGTLFAVSASQTTPTAKQPQPQQPTPSIAQQYQPPPHQQTQRSYNMNRAIGWGIGLLAAAALCGFLNVAGAYADNGKAAMAILAVVLLLISLVLFYTGAKRPAPHQETASPPQQHYQRAAPEQQPQPLPPQQSSSGGVLFVPRSLDEQNRPGER